MRISSLKLIAVSLLIPCFLIWWRFDQDIEAATARSTLGSKLMATRCGTIEYQEVGKGLPLLVVPGAGGGSTIGL
jgi:hypothetical protein